MAVETRRYFTLYLTAGGLAARRTSRFSPRQLAEGLLTSLRPGERQAAAAWHTTHCAPTIADMGGLACLLPACRTACAAAGAPSHLPSTFATAVSNSARIALRTVTTGISSSLLSLLQQTLAPSAAAVARVAYAAADASAALERVAAAAHALMLVAAPDFFARLRSWTPSTVSDV